ncbi:protein NEN1-like isoform X2 [Phoenix dactylifera]|uniref:Protein NEN1-like isoform X2 n=1 Tax=Phoenix dactylifera TaxID=42345 RepID=A0A8B7CIM9_PHODC|nr:protein NEN1-like isoform X2 [Phoenix dactylifera]
MEMEGGGGREEIAFFDVETTLPGRGGGIGYSLLEFGAILVSPRQLVEVRSYSTLIRPADPSAIASTSVRCNGINPETVASAPSFPEVADQVFAILHGRVWAGHNIAGFDCAVIREAFAEIGRAPPEPKGIIDTLPLLAQRFGRRAGDMKLASLASYFGLGQQKHRSLDDVRMNIEVLKCCATVLFLEASLPDVFSIKTPEMFCTIIPASEGCNSFAGFLEPDEVSVQDISASIVPSSHCDHKLLIQHRDGPLQLCCMGLRVQFGPSRKFMDHAGRPKLNIVVDIPESLCKVLEACDLLAQKSSQNSSSRSEWKPVIRKDGYPNSNSIRLHIPIVANGDAATYSTEIYQKLSGNMLKLVFAKYDDVALDSLFVPGTCVDAYFCVETYAYEQYAGIRLVAKTLILHSKQSII